nr:MAG TPA: hypothetical protein [Caudoviricetes sp.]
MKIGCIYSVAVEDSFTKSHMPNTDSYRNE